MMQTQKFLLKGLATASKNKQLPETLEFMKLSQSEIPKYSGSLEDIDGISNLFAQRASFLSIKAGNALKKEENSEQAFLDLQPFELKDMCEAYHDTYNIESFKTFLQTFKDAKTKNVFSNLLLLHIHVRMMNHGSFFFKVLGEGEMDNLKNRINEELKTLRGEIVRLTSILPFPNRMMGALGNEDMQVYERFIQHFKAAPKVTERPEWWKLSYTNSEQKISKTH